MIRAATSLVFLRKGQQEPHARQRQWKTLRTSKTALFQAVLGESHCSTYIYTHTHTHIYINIYINSPALQQRGPPRARPARALTARDRSRLRRRCLSKWRHYVTHDATTHTTLRTRRRHLRRCCCAAARRIRPQRLQLEPARRRRRRRLLRIPRGPPRLARVVGYALPRVLPDPLHPRISEKALCGLTDAWCSETAG